MSDVKTEAVVDEVARAIARVDGVNLDWITDQTSPRWAKYRQLAEAALTAAHSEIIALRARVEEVERERDAAKEWSQLRADDIMTLDKRVGIAEAQVAALKEALAWYGDAARYQGRLVTEECGCCTYEDDAEIGPDGDTGERARATLASLEATDE